MREQKSLRRETDKAMNTEIIKIDRNNIDKEKIAHCAEVIRKGGLVCFHTETVYGIFLLLTSTNGARCVRLID